jgi:invasion protein IalB
MRIAVSAFLALMIGAAAAFAQAPAAAPAKMTPEQKQAISKSCTDQANTKGLHGKERKKFRSECKHNAGKPQ